MSEISFNFAEKEKYLYFVRNFLEGAFLENYIG